MSQMPEIKRKLTTILAADAANYSGLMARDEVATIQALRRARRIIDSTIAARGGRIANTSGDGLIAEFASVVEAVAAAVSIQRALNDGEGLLAFRIGLHLGDVIIEGDDLLGDGVNLAARLQENACVGGILVSQQIVDHAKGRLDVEFRPLGPATPKNLAQQVALFGVLADGVKAPADLADVAPRVSRGPVAQNAPEPASIDEKDAHEKFKKTAKRSGVTIGILFVVDLLAGPGPGWATLAILSVALPVYLKWRKLPKA